MPMENYFSARLESPKKFDKFRYSKGKGGSGVDFVYGIKDGKSKIQAIRFSKDKFDKSQIKDWLKDHSKKYLSIEGKIMNTSKVINEIYEGKKLRDILLSEAETEDKKKKDEEEDEAKGKDDEPDFMTPTEDEKEEPVIGGELDASQIEKPSMNGELSDADIEDQSSMDGLEGEPHPAEGEEDFPNEELNEPSTEPSPMEGPEFTEVPTEDMGIGSKETPFAITFESTLQAIKGISSAELEETVGNENFYFIEIETDNQSVAKTYEQFKLNGYDETLEQVTNELNTAQSEGKISSFEIIDQPTPNHEAEGYFDKNYIILRVIV